MTRRCSQRLFLLSPSRLVNEVFLYCLAYAAQRHSIRVHAFCVLSNHYHLVVTDPRSELPGFMQWLDGTLARCLNAHHGRTENFFAPGSYNGADLTDGDDVLAKMVYTLVNPVAAGLVASADDWPGLRSSTLRGGPRTIVAKRPAFFFRKDGKLPDEVELVVERPEALRDLSDEEFGKLLDRAVRERQKEIQDEFRAKGATFLGRERVLRQSPFEAPGSRQRRGRLKPRVAAADKWRRIEALKQLREFLEAYKEALEKFCAGVRDVIFPAGTYWMRVHHGVRCFEPP